MAPRQTDSCRPSATALRRLLGRAVVMRRWSGACPQPGHSSLGCLDFTGSYLEGLSPTRRPCARLRAPHHGECLQFHSRQRPLSGSLIAMNRSGFFLRRLSSLVRSSPPRLTFPGEPSLRWGMPSCRQPRTAVGVTLSPTANSITPKTGSTAATRSDPVRPQLTLDRRQMLQRFGQHRC